MTQPYCSGPVNVSFGADAIGYGERGPRIRWINHFHPIMGDQAGPSVPLDVLFASQEAFVTVRLSSYDYDKVQSMRHHPTEVFGEIAVGDIGTLMITEGKAKSLTLEFPYGGRMGGGMIGGIIFSAAMPESVEESTGTEGQFFDCSWHCIPEIGNDGKFTLCQAL